MLLDQLAHYLGSVSNRQEIYQALGAHVVLALLPLIIGVVVAIPIGWAAARVRRLRSLLVGTANVVYTIPSLALFIALPAVLGTRILDPINVVAGLSVYTVALMLRSVIDALDAVPAHAVASATAMGYRPLRRLFAVELPLAVPVLAAAVRVASASNISLVSVGALIGIGGLGTLFTEGFQIGYLPPIIVGVVLTLLLALAVDGALVVLRRLLTPWARARVGDAT